MSEQDVLFFMVIIIVPIIFLAMILIDVLGRRFGLIELSGHSDNGDEK